MSSNSPVLEGYPYGAAWKASVDRTGAEWRAYCEAVQCLKWYFRDKLQLGKAQASTLYERYCARVGAERGEVMMARLKRDFLLVGEHEGDAILADVQEGLARRECAEAA